MNKCFVEKKMLVTFRGRMLLISVVCVAELQNTYENRKFVCYYSTRLFTQEKITHKLFVGILVVSFTSNLSHYVNRNLK